MSICIDCPKEVKSGSLRCDACHHARLAEARKLAKQRALERKKRTEHLKAARAQYDDTLQARLRTEARQRMSRRAAA
jgi:hypothetical protein